MIKEREELFEEGESKKFIFSSFYKILILIAVIWFGLYVGDILFGARSIEALLKVKKQEKELKTEIKKLKQENSKLQKDLFRYQVLAGE